MTEHLHSSKAEALIKATGERATQARISVLDVLLSAEHALSHQEIEQKLADEHNKIDRVTLYRVLDWALHQNLAHKVTGDDRVWRFSAAASSDHAHFNCTGCGQIYCLNNLSPAVALSLPDGFKLKHADLAIRGLCPKCKE